MDSADKSLLRRLSEEYRTVTEKDVQEERRDLWRRQNSLQGDRPLIYARAFAWLELPESECRCGDAFYREYENFFRHALYWDSLNDDSVFEPWVTVGAACVTPPEGEWGLPIKWVEGDDPRGAKAMDPPIKDPEDAQRLMEPRHVIDEAETERRVARLHDAIGDVLPINVERATVYRNWVGDISTYLARLRGLDQMMFDMMERPEWLHGVLAFMRDGVLKAQEEAEQAGDWTLSSHSNQAMPYAEELADPLPNSVGVSRDRLWCFCASQETTLLGPQQFDEFMFQYQLPIMANFGLVAYGCCEDLTLKIDVIRQLPNLRRIAVSPMADAAKCAEQIGMDYILSYRPSPSDMVGYDFDEDRIRRILRRDLEACRGCHVDITLKDVETVQHDPNRVRRWVEITREVIDEVY
jgi:hypothetical protein